MTKLKLFLLALILFPLCFFMPKQPPADSKFYEMRVYYANPGKLEDLQRRFREHTAKLFEKHGMTNVGYWVPLENLDNQLIYILSYTSEEARQSSWKAFNEDTVWQKAKALSEVNGSLVEKVESTFLKTTDFSPSIKPDSADSSRVFELRIYKTPKGKLNNLLERFRNHTMKLFEKHGMTNIGYWVPVQKEQGADNTLIYLLAHKTKDVGLNSFKTFGNDPEWQKVHKTSEAKGPIVETIKSVYMAPTDYSPIK